MMYHARDGFQFERRDDGSVLLRHEHTVHDGSRRSWETILSPSEWAGVVASVCKQGESARTHGRALSFHEVGGLGELRDGSRIEDGEV